MTSTWIEIKQLPESRFLVEYKISDGAETEVFRSYETKETLNEIRQYVVKTYGENADIRIEK